MAEFKDITVTGMDDASSKPSGKGKTVDIVLKLSSVPAVGLVHHFNALWLAHVFSTKQKIRIAGSSVYFTSVLGEVQDHIHEINKIFREAGVVYRARLLEAQRQQEISEANQAATRAEISEFAKTLKFD